MEDKDYLLVSFVMRTQVGVIYPVIKSSSPLPGMIGGRGHLHKEVYVLLLGRKGEGREFLCLLSLNCFHSKTILMPK